MTSFNPHKDPMRWLLYLLSEPRKLRPTEDWGSDPGGLSPEPVLPTIVCVCVCLCVKSLSHVQLFVTPWTVAHQAPLSMASLQARILEWVAISSSRGSSRPRG